MHETLQPPCMRHCNHHDTLQPPCMRHCNHHETLQPPFQCRPSFQCSSYYIFSSLIVLCWLEVSNLPWHSVTTFRMIFSHDVLVLQQTRYDCRRSYYLLFSSPINQLMCVFFFSPTSPLDASTIVRVLFAIDVLCYIFLRPMCVLCEIDVVVATLMCCVECRCCCVDHGFGLWEYICPS